MRNAERIDILDNTTAGMIRSDMLRPIREFAATIPWMREMGLPVQFRVVIDANVVLSDLLWLTRKRSNPHARTGLQEVVDAGTLLAIAPSWLDQEVREHAGEMAARAGVSVEQYFLEWKKYRTSIIFVQPKGIGRGSEIDPDDVPYVSTYYKFGAHAVYSKDHHITQMGARTIDEQVIVTLRDYSRAASWQYTIQYGGITVTILGWHTLIASLHILGGIARFVRSSPRWVQGLLLAGGVALIAHPSSRAWLAETTRRFASSLRAGASETIRVGIQLGAQAALKQQEAHEALAQIDGSLKNRRIPLAVSVRVLCLNEQRPLSLDEIEHEVLANGYHTKAKDFTRYLRRVLSNYLKRVGLADSHL